MLNYYYFNLMETKKCTTCGEIKPINEFYKRKRRKDGLSPQCKCCENKKHKEYYKKHLEKIKKYEKEYQKEYQKKHREYLNKCKNEYTALLKSWYVKRLLISLGWRKEDITEEIIEEHRNIIKTKRLINKINKVINQTGDIEVKIETL